MRCALRLCGPAGLAGSGVLPGLARARLAPSCRPRGAAEGAKGAETPSPRHSFIPAVTPALAARGMPLWGPRGPPAGSGRRPGPGLSEARLAGAHGRGRRPSGAAPAPAAALPAPAAAPAATPEGLGRSHAGKTYPVGAVRWCAEGRLWCRLGGWAHRHRGTIAQPGGPGGEGAARFGCAPEPHLLPPRSSRAGSPRSGRPCDLRAAERPQPPKPA